MLLSCVLRLLFKHSFLNFSCFGWLLRFRDLLVRYFVPRLKFIRCFAMITLGLRVFRRKTTRTEFSSRHSISRMGATNITHDSYLGHLAEVMSSGFSIVKLFSSPFHTVLSGREVTTLHRPHLRTRELCPTFQKAKYLRWIFLCRRCVAIHLLFILFSHLFTSHSQIHFILWAVIQYHCINFVPITAPALAVMSSFDWHPGPVTTSVFQSLPLGHYQMSQAHPVYSPSRHSQLGVSLFTTEQYPSI